jgi:hypothetical protein
VTKKVVGVFGRSIINPCWEEIMTKDMSKDAIIHAWRGNGGFPGGALITAAKNGYNTVFV